MSDTTLSQGNEILNLILKKRVPASQIQALLESGLLSDILDANTEEIDRFEFLRFVGLRNKAMSVLYKDFMRRRDVGQTRRDHTGKCGVCHKSWELMPVPDEESVIIRHRDGFPSECSGSLQLPCIQQ